MRIGRNLTTACFHDRPLVHSKIYHEPSAQDASDFYCKDEERNVPLFIGGEYSFLIILVKSNGPSVRKHLVEQLLVVRIESDRLRIDHSSCCGLNRCLSLGD